MCTNWSGFSATPGPMIVKFSLRSLPGVRVSMNALVPCHSSTPKSARSWRRRRPAARADWCAVGGAASAFYVVSTILLFPRLGAVVSVGLSIAGQMLAETIAGQAERFDLFKGTLIFVSHDRHLLRATTDDLYLVADGKVVPFTPRQYYGRPFVRRTMPAIPPACMDIDPWRRSQTSQKD